MATRNKRIRFGDNNFLTDLAAASVAVSSEMANFGKANLTNAQRSKVYRTNGNFTIGATNNSIYINDGTDRTITLNSANYSGGAALASHVQTQLNASSSNWTCTYSTTTNKFTLARSSGTDTLRFATTTNASWDTLGYTTASDTAASVAGVADEARSHTDEHITFDLGTAVSIQEFHLIGPLSEVFSISSSATIQLMGNTSDAWTSPALTVTPVRDTGGIHHYLDTEAGTSTSYRYWRFRFVDRTNTVGSQGFKIGHIYLGDYNTVTTTNVSPGLKKGYDDPSADAESDSGVQFFKTRLKRRVFDDMRVGFIEASERRTLEAMFETLGISTPFYLCLDPLNEVSDNLSEVTIYGRFDREPSFGHIIRDLYSMSFVVKEAV